MRATLDERVTVKPDGCWDWSNANAGGYGMWTQHGVTIPAHRLMYRLLVGPIPVGRDLDHLCRNRRCVNPEHLEPVTRRENLLRGETIPASRAAQTHCHQGHPLTGPNLYRRPDGKGRDCRLCRSEADRRRRR